MLSKDIKQPDNLISRIIQILTENSKNLRMSPEQQKELGIDREKLIVSPKEQLNQLSESQLEALMIPKEYKVDNEFHPTLLHWILKQCDKDTRFNILDRILKSQSNRLDGITLLTNNSNENLLIIISTLSPDLFTQFLKSISSQSCNKAALIETNRHNNGFTFCANYLDSQAFSEFIQQLSNENLSQAASACYPEIKGYSTGLQWTSSRQDYKTFEYVIKRLSPVRLNVADYNNIVSKLLNNNQKLTPDEKKAAIALYQEKRMFIDNPEKAIHENPQPFLKFISEHLDKPEYSHDLADWHIYLEKCISACKPEEKHIKDALLAHFINVAHRLHEHCLATGQNMNKARVFSTLLTLSQDQKIEGLERYLSLPQVLPLITSYKENVYYNYKSGDGTSYPTMLHAISDSNKVIDHALETILKKLQFEDKKTGENQLEKILFLKNYKEGNLFDALAIPNDKKSDLFFNFFEELPPYICNRAALNEDKFGASTFRTIINNQDSKVCDEFLKRLSYDTINHIIQRDPITLLLAAGKHGRPFLGNLLERLTPLTLNLSDYPHVIQCLNLNPTLKPDEKKQYSDVYKNLRHFVDNPEQAARDNPKAFFQYISPHLEKMPQNDLEFWFTLLQKAVKGFQPSHAWTTIQGKKDEKDRRELQAKPDEVLIHDQLLSHLGRISLALYNKGIWKQCEDKKYEYQHYLAEAKKSFSSLMNRSSEKLSASDKCLAAIVLTEGKLEDEAKTGLPEAQFKLALLHDSKDKKKAFEHFKQAADKGHPAALLFVADRYMKGIGTPKQEKSAMEYYQKAAKQGDPDAHFKLGLLIKDEKNAFEHMKEAADLGLPDAQFKLGLLYSEGKGTTKNESRAFDYLVKAANQGRAIASRFIADRYAHGKGDIKKDDKIAFHYYLQAAKQGDSEAQVEVGERYAFGRGTAKNEAEAFYWYREADIDLSVSGYHRHHYSDNPIIRYHCAILYEYSRVYNVTELFRTNPELYFDLWKNDISLASSEKRRNKAYTVMEECVRGIKHPFSDRINAELGMNCFENEKNLDKAKLFFSKCDPIHLSSDENFNAGLFYYTYADSIRPDPAATKFLKKASQHFQKAAVDGNDDAKRWLTLLDEKTMAKSYQAAIPRSTTQLFSDKKSLPNSSYVMKLQDEENIIQHAFKQMHRELKHLMDLKSEPIKINKLKPLSDFIDHYVRLDSTHIINRKYLHEIDLEINRLALSRDVDSSTKKHLHTARLLISKILLDNQGTHNSFKSLCIKLNTLLKSAKEMKSNSKLNKLELLTINPTMVIDETLLLKMSHIIDTLSSSIPDKKIEHELALIKREAKLYAQMDNDRMYHAIQTELKPILNHFTLAETKKETTKEKKKDTKKIFGFHKTDEPELRMKKISHLFSMIDMPLKHEVIIDRIYILSIKNLIEELLLDSPKMSKPNIAHLVKMKGIINALDDYFIKNMKEGQASSPAAKKS